MSNTKTKSTRVQHRIFDHFDKTDKSKNDKTIGSSSASAATATTSSKTSASAAATTTATATSRATAKTSTCDSRDYEYEYVDDPMDIGEDDYTSVVVEDDGSSS